MCLTLWEAQTRSFKITCYRQIGTLVFILPACFSVSPDSEDEDLVKKSKKSPKEKQKSRARDPPPKKDPVQYVSETGSWTSVYHHIGDVLFWLGGLAWRGLSCRVSEIFLNVGFSVMLRLSSLVELSPGVSDDCVIWLRLKSNPLYHRSELTVATTATTRDNYTAQDGHSLT